MTRCQHPYFANDSFAVDVSNYVGAESSLASNVTKLDECSYTINDTQSIKCTNWVYDKSYYQTTLTEEVCWLLFFCSCLFRSSFFFRCFTRYYFNLFDDAIVVNGL